MSRAVLPAAAALVLSTFLGAANAVSMPVAPAAPAAPDSVVQQVHGCHRSCEWGPVLRWHRHGAACRVIACAPRAAYPGRCFVDRYGVRHCRW